MQRTDFGAICNYKCIPENVNNPTSSAAHELNREVPVYLV